MACLIIRVGAHEVVRRRLDRPLVLGRSPECDISIAHPLLSRRHCRIDFDGNHWSVTDLQSLNGIWLEEERGPERIANRILRNGDHLRIGIAHLFFEADALGTAPHSGRKSRSRSRRPAEPMRRVTLGGGDGSRKAAPAALVGSLRPAPRPRPRDPVSYSRDNLYSMFTYIAVNSSAAEARDGSTAPHRCRPSPQPVARSARRAAVPQGLPAREPDSSNSSKRRNRRWPVGRVAAAAALTLVTFLFGLCARVRLT